MATKRHRYMISVDDGMFEAIEDFRFSRRYPTRSEATAELIRLGLMQLAGAEGYPQSLPAEEEAPAVEKREAVVPDAEKPARSGNTGGVRGGIF